MKKNLHLICLGLLLSAIPLFAQIPNGGFENWISMNTYDLPYGWATLNNKTAAQTMFTAAKAIPGNPGSSYLKLTSKTIGGSVVPGVAVCGKMDTMTMLPKSGFAYSQRSATFSGKWQHMIYGGSQGSITVLLTKWNTAISKRDTIAYKLQGLSGMAMSWANFSFNLTYMDSLQNPDSCIVVLRSSGSAPTNNDYLWVDGLAFSGTVAIAQPQNLVGLKENASRVSKISVFPNPASNQIVVNYNLIENNKISIQIIDISGKVVKEILPVNSAIGVNTVIIETNTLTKGIYSLIMMGNNIIQSNKLVIE